MDTLKTSSDVLFILLGAVMVLAMHAGFAFLELGTVRRKNQVNALVKILADFSMSTVAYFFIGYSVAYGTSFLVGAQTLAEGSGYQLTKFFFLLTFAAAVPAIVSGGIAERARFQPQLAASFALVAFVYPFFEGIAWNGKYGVQAWLEASFGAPFHDFAGSVVVHAMGGWVGAGSGAAAGRAARPLRQGRRSRGAPALQHPVPGAGGVGAERGMVRLQRHVGADHRQDQRPGRGQLADGDGGRHAGGAVHRPQRPRLRAQRAARRAGGDLRRLGPDASDRRLGDRGGRRRPVRACCSPSPRTAGRSTTCWACGRCMACAARGAASPPASSASRRWAAWAG